MDEVQNSASVEFNCEEKFPGKYEGEGLYCPRGHDNLTCWPSTPANTTASILCPVLLGSNRTAHRFCQPDGRWSYPTNYARCLEILSERGVTMPDSQGEEYISKVDAYILSTIIFVGSVISIIVLSISLFIFVRFKSLQCQRTSLHKNLVVSFLVRFIISAIIVEPFVFGNRDRGWYTESPWLCKSLVFLQNYSYMCNFCWMLAEGLYLHYILVLRPLSNEKAPFWFFYILGWVVPLLVASVWAVVMHFEHDVECWRGNPQIPYMFIIYAPIMLTLTVNLFILMNLVRIVIHKLCTGHQAERRKICRTIKSTVVLVFLLGICNLFFFAKPGEQSAGEKIYRYTNTILPPLQGIFVSLLYCFLNADVRRAVKKKWSRYQDSRHMGLRRRSSRTSVSLVVSNQVQCNGHEQSPMIELNRFNHQGRNSSRV